MDIKTANALSAYTDALKRATQAPEDGGQDGTGMGLPSLGQGPSFSEMVTEALEGAVQVERVGEQTAVMAAAGKVDLVDMVTAVTNAEVTLQTVVTVRDRIISAYQEIIRMPI